MGDLIPRAKLLAVIEPHDPKGERGRPPIGLERMLRVYFLQPPSMASNDTSVPTAVDCF